jgi:N-terminal domain of (some) glycogen debranching enzymes
VYADPTLSVIRSRVLGQGDGEDLHETLTVTNCSRSVVVVELAVASDADFAISSMRRHSRVRWPSVSQHVAGSPSAR